MRGLGDEEGVDIELDEEYKIISDSNEYRLRHITEKCVKTVAHCSTLEYALEQYIDRRAKLSGAESIKELKSVLRKAMDIVNDVRDQFEVC